MKIESNIHNIKNVKKSSVQLIIVTKNQNLNNIKTVYKLGERDFGENRVQDLIIKKTELPNDIKWHMIGHLQTKKVKLIAPFIYMIQSVDSIKLLETINKYGEKYNRVINCLIQIKIAKETTKFGFSLLETKQLLQSNYQSKYSNINIKGLMGMATFTENKIQIKKEFESIKNIYSLLLPPNSILSIGMSYDYKTALKAGSNMIRIGSDIFK